MAVLNKYKNKSGYEISATEKAFKLFYETQGFKPIESDAVMGENVSFEKMNVQQLKSVLKEAGVEFKTNACKSELIELCKEKFTNQEKLNGDGSNVPESSDGDGSNVSESSDGDGSNVPGSPDGDEGNLPDDPVKE